MTKLQVLNAYFTERLMVAVHEIMNVVGETLFEYQDETERTKRENEILRRRLRDVGLDAEAGFPQSAPLLSADRAVSEQQEWSSREQDPDPPLTAVKLEFTEPQRNRREEEEDHRQEEELHCAPESGTDGSVIPSPCSKRECDLDSLNQPTFPSPCGKQGSQQDSDNHPDVILHIGNTEEQELVPNVTHYPVKTETGGVDCDISDHPAESLFLDVLPTQSENGGRVNGRISSRAMLVSTEQRSTEKQSVLQGESSLSCVYCGKVFIHVSRLKSHLKTHTDEFSFRCSVCTKSFRQARLLSAHQRVHTANKPYCCNICGKSFHYLAKFKEHQRIHTGERPYRCSFCGKYFSQSGHLKAHVRIHTGEKPYRCPVCGSCFSQLSQIKRHLVTHAQDVSVVNSSP
ncbi:zinc finger protein 16-like [Conger conger]|uniref:zinc finger protein 16-like n=1 Tax=Conger conger TaxID=82655 RepID=UPI002A5A010A|nr:zinc finger protein 16-like [Conger conger]